VTARISIQAASDVREAGAIPALPRNCNGGRRPIMPLRKREGGPEWEPQARRPVGWLGVCRPRGWRCRV